MAEASDGGGEHAGEVESAEVERFDESLERVASNAGPGAVAIDGGGVPGVEHGGGVEHGRLNFEQGGILRCLLRLRGQ